MLIARLLRSSVTARSSREFRERALALLETAVAYDAAIFHALSPRVPLETAVIVGLDIERVRASLPHWDRLAVELGRLRDIARDRGGVATDRDAFAPRSKSRARFDAEVARKLRIRTMVIAHLAVRDSIRSAVLLFRKTDKPFDDRDQQILREVTPLLALSDTLHSELDGLPPAKVPVRLRCRDQRLTQRQREIVEHIALGHTNAAIAEALGVSPNTLRNHVVEIFRRLGAANRADVVRLAVLTP